MKFSSPSMIILGKGDFEIDRYVEIQLNPLSTWYIFCDIIPVFSLLVVGHFDGPLNKMEVGII